MLKLQECSERDATQSATVHTETLKMERKREQCCSLGAVSTFKIFTLLLINTFVAACLAGAVEKLFLHSSSHSLPLEMKLYSYIVNIELLLSTESSSRSFFFLFICELEQFL